MANDDSLSKKFEHFRNQDQWPALTSLHKKAIETCFLHPLQTIYKSATQLKLHREMFIQTNSLEISQIHGIRSSARYLHELPSVIEELEQGRRSGCVFSLRIWERLCFQSQDVKVLLSDIQAVLADYSPVFRKSFLEFRRVIEDMKIVVEEMLLVCYGLYKGFVPFQSEQTVRKHKLLMEASKLISEASRHGDWEIENCIATYAVELLDWPVDDGSFLIKIHEFPAIPTMDKWEELLTPPWYRSLLVETYCLRRFRRIYLLVYFLRHDKENALQSCRRIGISSLPRDLRELYSVIETLDKLGSRSRKRTFLYKNSEGGQLIEKIKSVVLDCFPFMENLLEGNCVIKDLKVMVDEILFFLFGFIEEAIPLELPESQHEELPTSSTSSSKNFHDRSENKYDEVVVGFEDDTTVLLEQLTGPTHKKLQVISIVGMPGLGKTTLARKLYDDPFIKYHFYIQAWTSVSLEYVKVDLLLEILSSVTDQLTDKMHNLSDEQLGEHLYRRLKGQKYLMVLDDLWDNQTWDDLRKYFPDDKIGSRILLTSRNTDLNLGVGANVHCHRLRLRTEEESWKLFRMKVFQKKFCPQSLEILGKRISQKCHGLPLAIVITAGLLENTWSREHWNQVAESLTSYIVKDPDQYVNTLALSYNHLPPYLRPCFLYLGVVAQDCRILVKKLTWLWIAEGYVHETYGRKTLEDVAEDYFMELLKRSLVIVDVRGADGRIKFCRIHDLLRDLCLRKAIEENFMPTIYRYSVAGQRHGTSIHPGYSFWCFPVDETYKFLSVLDLESISTFLFPSEVVQLVHLRYLAVQAEDGNPPELISNLVYLQMLIISSRRNISIPRSMWSLKSLRHLSIKSGENLVDDHHFEELSSISGYPDVLDSLQTISQVCPSPACCRILLRTPNLRKLGFCGPLVSTTGVLEFPDICNLDHLQVLKLLNTNSCHKSVKSCIPSMFPERLKKLTLSNTALHWDELWTLGVLPNLQVLKLKFNACIGQRWETSEVGFRQLIFLKLQDLNIVQWVTVSDHFPRLQRLVFNHCSSLEKIPPCIGDMPSLELVEVGWCSKSAADSAITIQVEQKSNGNEFLKVVTNMHLADDPPSAI